MKIKCLFGLHNWKCIEFKTKDEKGRPLGIMFKTTWKCNECGKIKK